jgi:two-component system phosphate regulon response regulator PhoB
VAHENVLIVEDERDIAEMIAYNLNKEGFLTRIATTGEAALSFIAKSPPDLVLLDLMLPGLNGLAVCRRIKQTPASAGMPVIMLTAKGEDPDIIAGLETGADDYVTKPFSPRVLAARVRAVIRRTKQREALAAHPKVSIHGITIDVPRHEVTLDGQPVQLTATEFDLLALLSRNPGRVFSRGQIISAVKGDDYPVTERSVDVQVLGLRRKLGSRGGCIETVRGVGYRLRDLSRDGES